MNLSWCNKLRATWCSECWILWIDTSLLSWRLRRNRCLPRDGIFHHSNCWRLCHLLYWNILLCFKSLAKSIMTGTVTNTWNWRLLHLLWWPALYLRSRSCCHNLWWHFVDLDRLDKSLLKASTSGYWRRLLATTDGWISKVGVGWVDSWGGTSHHMMLRKKLHVVGWCWKVAESTMISSCLHPLVCSSSCSYWHHILYGPVVHQMSLWRLYGANHDSIIM